MNIIPIKRALLSVSDKTGIVDLANHLVNLNIEVISTGGTSKLLQASGIKHTQIEDITGLAPCLDGRVKTLHPQVHGGILGRRDVHLDEAKRLGIEWIDLVVVNFYPFSEVMGQADLSWDKIVEYIDIGGPTMVRGAAKNFAWVGVVVNPLDYSAVMEALTEQGGLDFAHRQRLAEKAFALTSRYDGMIHDYFQQLSPVRPEEARSAVSKDGDDRIPALRDGAKSTPPQGERFCILGANGRNGFPQQLTLQLDRMMPLRYGENPHQKACAYQLAGENKGILSAKQYQGKPLSYNNILDAESAIACLGEFAVPACVIVKHANPCGVATGVDMDEAYARAYQADPLAAFGGIVALNETCTKTVAEAITNIFMEVVIAPSFTADALAAFASKPNLRVLESSGQLRDQWEMKFITGGVLLQEKDVSAMVDADLRIVTNKLSSARDEDTMLFAWRVLKHIKSNAILIAKENKTIGIGCGQVSRIDAVFMALKKGGADTQGAVLASDAFFPFRDSIDALAKTGIRAIIQPGGSMRDDEVIAACNEYGIAMVFTGKRCFKH